MWYLVAPLTAYPDAVTVPSARVTVTDDGVAGGVTNGAMASELRHPLHWPESLPARTATMYDLALSAPLMVMLVPTWLSDAAVQLCRLSEL